MSIALDVIKDTASPGIVALKALLTPQRMAAAAGPRCAKLTTDHLRSLGQNKRGWPTTGFYARAAKSTHWRQVEDGALISISQIGMRQRYRGGPISPVNAGALAIPISPVSYGHTPKDFPGLFRITTPKGSYLVQYGDGSEASGRTKAARAKLVHGLKGNWKRRQRATLNFLFKLSAGVNQKPDPGVLPTKEEYTATAKEGLLAAVKTRGQGGTPA